MDGKGGGEWTDDRTTQGRGNSQEERNVGQRKRVVTKVNELKGS